MQPQNPQYNSARVLHQEHEVDLDIGNLTRTATGNMMALISASLVHLGQPAARCPLQLC